MSNQQAVSADDLLSSTIAAIVVAQPRHLVSCLEYIKLFHGAGDWSGKAGFQVATLEAAAAYIEQGDPAFSSSPAPGIQMKNTPPMASDSVMGQSEGRLHGRRECLSCRGCAQA